METVAEENPLRSATSRMVTASERERLREGSAADADSDNDDRRDLADADFFAGFESSDSMDSLYFALLLADTTGR